MVCSPVDGSLPATERLERPYFDLALAGLARRIDEPGGIEFNLPISSWLRLFHRMGLGIIDYIEIQAPESATGTGSTVTADWARRFPSEPVWRLKKR